MNSNLLLNQREAFEAFVRKRLGDPGLAADVVQDSLLKALRAEKQPTEDEGVVPWFYRILRHAIIDAHRRREASARALETYTQEVNAAPDAEEKRDICQCVKPLIDALSPEDASLLRQVDMEGASPTDLAAQHGLRVNTVNVRLHRARKKLRTQLEAFCRTCATHGCLDCDCAPPKEKRPS
ncbi:RNA polymerase sigma-70 factor (ECF subfamily) [Roseimicrobium gellanilyticum]|uniref:RNA polymerase sigma-70 factor (ECF subfamily) n=1 Tax=Roseimicrobium gellanilyticum TaxID=748857 RepID=A0A366H6F1_9BACT|nr:sigma-70 family RNA polymerase sigma factor [Roseimicrobium gellanilyticum]RBP37031.1 RNA polymerase sigma-70 factor (ECF subfamily) [Roseimicrobium gellanilyticum]